MRLFLDDVRNPSHAGLSDLEWVTVRSIDDFLTILILCSKGSTPNHVTEVSLDHDLGEAMSSDGLRTGYDLLKYMEQYATWPTNDVRVHSANPYGAMQMRSIVDRWQASKK
jgi:hypothetical protein